MIAQKSIRPTDVTVHMGGKAGKAGFGRFKIKVKHEGTWLTLDLSLGMTGYLASRIIDVIAQYARESSNGLA